MKTFKILALALSFGFGSFVATGLAQACDSPNCKCQQHKDGKACDGKNCEGKNCEGKNCDGKDCKHKDGHGHDKAPKK